MADDNVTQITNKTTANDQAEADPKAKNTKTPPKQQVAVFVSREREPVAFVVAGYTPVRRFSDMRLVWEVPGDDVERFMRHHHTQSNRVIRDRS